MKQKMKTKRGTVKQLQNEVQDVWDMLHKRINEVEDYAGTAAGELDRRIESSREAIADLEKQVNVLQEGSERTSNLYWRIREMEEQLRLQQSCLERAEEVVRTIRQQLCKHSFRTTEVTQPKEGTPSGRVRTCEKCGAVRNEQISWLRFKLIIWLGGFQP